MSEALSVPVPSSAPAKKTKPKVKKAPTSTHPKYSDMIVSAVKALRKPKGASRQAIASYLQANFEIPAASAKVISRNLKSMVTNQKLVLTTGVGAAGRYKVNKAKASPKKGKKPKVGKKKRGSPKKKKAKAKKRKSPVKKRSAKRSPKKRKVKRKTKKPAKRVAKKKPAKKGKK
uniref:Histone H1-delta-like n=1 Tax=Phallusia mammillata TaxID=59560 RepID=A0A6F9DDJ7_9ASCI|nr:histone H1-delta-like [Phallusia mammillata]